MDIGRNDPCPCGSGKKYKRCCGAPKIDPLEVAAGELRFVQAAAEAKLWRFIRDDLGNDAINDAREEFEAPAPAEDPDPSGDEPSLFKSWVLYDWVPWEPIPLSSGGEIERVTPTLMALAKRRDAFVQAEIDFLFNVSATPLSFHEVISLEPGRTLTLHDLMTGTHSTAYDRLGSTNIEPGDMLFSRPVDLKTTTLIVGCGRLLVPPMYKDFILQLRKELKPRLRGFTFERLREAEVDLRTMYLEIRYQLLNPSPPELANTDGDPMEFHTLIYTVPSAEAAVAALAPLASEERADDLIAEVRRARPGGKRRVEFAWTRSGNPMHGGMRNTVIADITITGTTLTIEVNSANRARLVNGEIATRLGDQALFVRDDRRSMRDALAAEPASPDPRRDRVARKRQEELEARPEIQAMIAKMTADHYGTWPDVPLPALKGRTPRAAMKTRDGRERVEALIADFERSQDAAPLKTPRYDFNQLRVLLGLPLRGA